MSSGFTSSRNCALLIWVRATPTTARFRGRKPAFWRFRIAGMSFRLVRSPEAPKMMITQGSAVRLCGGVSAVSSFWTIYLGSTWPPNCFRIAESSFSAKVCCCRERKRV